jgi:hypothetical protein
MRQLADHSTPLVRRLAQLVVIVSALAPGCRRDEITHFQVSKRPAAAAVGAAPAAPAGMTGEVAAPAAPANGIKWTLPKGWKATLVGGMRYATLQPPGAGRVDVSVVTLTGAAGGELANVNRWRGQLGLAPTDAAALASTRKEITTKAGPLSLYDFSSEGAEKTRMLAAVLVFEGNSWFVKMVGDAGAVTAARPDFVHLLQSLHFD